LVGGVLGGLWRARLELAVLAGPVLAYRELAGRVGDAGAVLVVTAAMGLLVGVPVSRRWLARALHAGRVRRRWRRAWVDVGLPRVRAGRVTGVPAGDLVRIRVSRGWSVDAVAARAEQ